MFSEARYLFLMQAIDAFSRVMTNATYVEDGEYQLIRAALSAAIPSETPADLRASLRSRIKYGNEFSLRKRLALLLRGLEPATRELICPNLDEYVERVVHTRNFLTHYSEDAEARPWPSELYYYVGSSVAMLLTILLYKCLDFTEVEIRSMIEKHFDTDGVIQMYQQRLFGVNRQVQPFSEDDAKAALDRGTSGGLLI